MKSIIWTLMLSLLCLSVQGQDSCVKLGEMIKIIEANHISPKELDSTSYPVILRLFINRVDENSLYLTKKDHDEILSTATKSDLCALMQVSVTRAKLKIIEAKHYFDHLNKNDITSSESYLIFNSEDSLILTKDSIELIRRWETWLEFKMMNQYFGDQDSLSANTDYESDYLRKKSAYKELIVQKERCKYQNLLEKIQNRPKFFESIFLEVLSGFFDPHTQYMDTETLLDFEASLSENKYSLGLTYTIDQNGKLVITGIEPGGAAWFSGQIHEGDEIKSIVVDEKEVNDFGCINLSDVSGLIKSDQPTEAKLEIQKQDGTKLSIDLESTELENPENLIRSYVLKGERSVGYLHLPSFYSDFEYYGPAGCADDMSKELLFLMRDQIDGLVIDLRNNGGGSLAEAVALIGLFVDYGTIGILETNEGLISIKDLHRGTIYDGPLLILVNKLSASASELFSSALQDYNRAIIAGSGTYGKVTTQQIINIDEGSDIKVTYGHYHRLNGTSLQAQGIRPDIYIPDILDGIIPVESSYSQHLSPKQIFKKVYSRRYDQLPIDTLKALSGIRIDSSERHRSSKEFIRFSKENIQQNKLATSFKDLHTFWQNWRVAFGSAINTSDSLAIPYTIETRYENQKLHIKNLSNDPNIKEAYAVICDLINITN